MSQDANVTPEPQAEQPSAEVSGTGPNAGQPTPATNDQGSPTPQLDVDPTSAGNTVTNPTDQPDQYYGDQGQQAAAGQPQQDVNIQGEVAQGGAASHSPTDPATQEQAAAQPQTAPSGENTGQNA